MEDGGREQSVGIGGSRCINKNVPQGATLDDKRNSVIINAGPRVPQVSASTFFERFMPQTCITAKQLKSIQTRVTRTAYHRGRWLAFPLGGRQSGKSKSGRV